MNLPTNASTKMNIAARSWIVTVVLAIGGTVLAMTSASGEESRTPSAGRGAGGTTLSADYKISANDLLDIKIYKDPDGSGQFRVSKDGSIQHPYLKNVKVAGLTESEAARRFISALRNGYFVNPRVTVTVLSYAKMRFVVLGQVNAPDTYEVPANRKLTLVQAIGIAKGFTDVANQRKVVLTRIVKGKPQSWAINVKAMMDSPERYRPIYIQDGDQLTVKENLF